jgi:hypothetical protein
MFGEVLPQGKVFEGVREIIYWLVEIISKGEGCERIRER